MILLTVKEIFVFSNIEEDSEYDLEDKLFPLKHYGTK